MSVPTSSNPFTPSNGQLEATEANIEYLALSRLLESLELCGQTLAAEFDANHRARLGQFFTPSKAAKLIVGMIDLPHIGSIKVLDPGAGIGSLSAALVARVVRERPKLQLSIYAVEVDPELLPYLQETLDKCVEIATRAGVQLTTKIASSDIVELATGWNRDLLSQFDVVVMNPPYRKLGSRSFERRSLASVGVDSPNLYSTFLTIGSLALIPGGQLVAITPRSFTNGPYFGGFRRFFLEQVALDRIHVFESRSTVFANASVLQENIIISARKWMAFDSVILSASRGHTDTVESRIAEYHEIVRPGDRHQFIHIPTNGEDTSLTTRMETLPCTLAETGMQVSTGKVVDFRSRDYLLPEPVANSIPLIYPGNVKDGRVRWPYPIRKPKALALNERTRKLVLPSERFVVVKRFSAKEERRRVVAGVYEPKMFGNDGVAFENHLNVFHAAGHGFDPELAQGLCLWLNSSIVDRFFRTFSGHTQVNATDLRSMRFPSPDQLRRLGLVLAEDWLEQDAIDDLVHRIVFFESTSI